ncbi:flagellar motor switch protein FliN [Pigmentiphaga litoralis]|uniref:Flagellar motor switch protein FliN n=1 Tax=Pigmentiphaga litoralis TaxID=516702 RepID=A0A7Y9IZK8_9BURK|nr:flagellar motor switch protein FliN [Pigmentiphaga litoralis]NYE26855.1 flagellar motor switch protein FliN/FliY [Pigmentiphaga litoralis]NYE85735.1 flagellar motor switch protein FliN/FliY [Pigmentiphaga litoralis]
MATEEPGSELPDAESSADLDWAAAMAEQSQAAAAAQPARLADELFEEFASAAPASSPAPNDIEIIMDIPVTLTVELGRTRIPIKQILQLAQGSVVELDGLAGEPMDVMVNGCLIAQGEVVVVNDKFGIRLTDIVTPSERLRRLNR